MTAGRSRRQDGTSWRDCIKGPGLATFWVHAALLAVVLLLVWPIVSGPTIVHPDEAVYGAQARNIAYGSWFSSRPAPDLDPDAVHEPLFSEIAHGDQVIPYARHITYPLLLVPGWILAGRAGITARL